MELQRAEEARRREEEETRKRQEAEAQHCETKEMARMQKESEAKRLEEERVEQERTALAAAEKKKKLYAWLLGKSIKKLITNGMLDNAEASKMQESEAVTTKNPVKKCLDMCAEIAEKRDDHNKFYKQFVKVREAWDLTEPRLLNC